MKVSELIKQLKELPQEAEVSHLWDGEARTNIENVWLARDGSVVTADYGMVCYSTETRPKDAPSAAKNPYWKSPDEASPQDI